MHLVFLHGGPASGKLTIGRSLAARTGLALFHNHLVVDAVGAVFPFGSEPFVRLREQFWLAVFREAAADDRSLIFTFAPEPTVSPGFPASVRRELGTAGGTVVFVRLLVDPAEQEHRLAGEARAAFGKLRSVEQLRRLRPAFAACEAAMPAADLTIDTGAVAPEDAARLIAERFGLAADGT